MSWLGKWAGGTFGVWFGATAEAGQPVLLMHAGSEIAFDEEDEVRTLFALFLQVTHAQRQLHR